MSVLNRYRTLFKKVDPNLMQWHDQLDSVIDDIYTKIGSNAPAKVDSVSPLAPSQPPLAILNVLATPGTGYKVQIVNPQNVQSASMSLARARITKGPNAPLATVYHNLQSALDTNFNSGSNVTDHGVSTQTIWAIPTTGLSLYWRFRSSFDGQNWNPWQIFSGPNGPIAVSA